MSLFRKAVFGLVVVALGVSGTSLLAADGPRRDGKWETTMRMEMPGLPIKLPAVKTVTCVTKEDAENPEKSVPSASREGSCKVSDYQIDGQTVTWKFKCEGKNPSTGEGTLTYTENAYDGELIVDTDGQEMTMKMSGKRLGDCEK